MEQIQDKKVSIRVLLASLIGSSIEWFDYFLYGTVAALIFNQLYFPAEDKTVGTMLAFMSFGLSFFIRPFGGIFFSHIGDKIGRKKTLVLTLALMGGATVLMGLLPTYQAIGIAAPILMILLRLVQGLGIGGEWGGAMLLAVEYAPKEKRGLFGAVPQMGGDSRYAFGNTGTDNHDHASRRGLYVMGLACAIYRQCTAGIFGSVDS